VHLYVPQPICSSFDHSLISLCSNSVPFTILVTQAELTNHQPSF
jgi:hypothetical protein